LVLGFINAVTHGTLLTSEGSWGSLSRSLFVSSF
jgi:hypothetical protein